MISQAKIEEGMYQAMKFAATTLPPDVKSALKKISNEEETPLAKEHLRVSFENERLAQEGNGLVCGDTGYPLYFITIGNDVEVEGGFCTLKKAAQNATARATDDSYLRPTMVDPLRRTNPGNNLGAGMPKVEIVFEPEMKGMRVVAAPKGGGSEIFGTFYKMLYPSDGESGIIKFILESIRNACYAGKICPPAIIGVGIGGTADLCMKMAKEAALLRKVGEVNKDKKVAALEKKIFDATRELGLGPMGSAGINAVMGLHIETAMTHTAALPVAVNAQCLVGRRWIAEFNEYGEVYFTGELS
jgi:tartrate/fumarate subfamily iron-sulfur-dependent hydro-lyase alpha chain